MKYTSCNGKAQREQRSLTAQLRFGILPLRVETGRFANVQLENRICEICDQNVIEDECHFLFECVKYADIRSTWEMEVRNQCKEMDFLNLEDQLAVLFNLLPRSTAKFITKCFHARKCQLYR